MCASLIALCNVYGLLILPAVKGLSIPSDIHTFVFYATCKESGSARKFLSGGQQIYLQRGDIAFIPRVTFIHSFGIEWL
jgi:hypothetical protein